MKKITMGLALIAVLGCGSNGAAVQRSDAGSIGDASPADATTPSCSTAGMDAYVKVAASAMLTKQIKPSETATSGETIRDELQGRQKYHYLTMPTDGRPLRDELFLWLGGSGTNPENYGTVMNIAAAAGYAGISLAYDNETSIGDLCSSKSNPTCNDETTPDCERGARSEMIYGRDDSPCLDVPRADSIEHRLIRLLQHLQKTVPNTGAAKYLTADGQSIVWSKVVVAGWSQGGGHASMLARDHEVARALYISKGAGSNRCSAIAKDLKECDLDGDGTLTPGNEDEALVPTTWAHDPRATKGDRQFAIVHQSESAWHYSREVFELFGMGKKADAKSIDGLGAYPAAYSSYDCRHVFSTAATPGKACESNEYHSSMAADLCMALDPTGTPVLAPAYYYALTVPLSSK